MLRDSVGMTMTERVGEKSATKTRINIALALVNRETFHLFWYTNRFFIEYFHHFKGHQVSPCVAFPGMPHNGRGALVNLDKLVGYRAVYRCIVENVKGRRMGERESERCMVY